MARIPIDIPVFSGASDWHRRPWSERPIFGPARWMSRTGIERTTGAAAYIRESKELTA